MGALLRFSTPIAEPHTPFFMLVAADPFWFVNTFVLDIVSLLINISL